MDYKVEVPSKNGGQQRFPGPRDQAAFARPELSTSRFHLPGRETFPPTPQTHTQTTLELLPIKIETELKV